MPPRRSTTTTVEPESTETETPSDEKSATIADVKAVVSEAIESIKGMFDKDSRLAPEESEGTSEEVTTEDKLPSPRRVEIDTERSVREALGGLTINVNSGREEKTEAKEPEQTPGGISKLTKFIWGKDA